MPRRSQQQPGTQSDAYWFRESRSRPGGTAPSSYATPLPCARTFSDFTGTPLAHLKLVDRWPAFCRCMLDSLTVRAAGRRLSVDKDTAFRWRHRILEAIDASDTATLGPSVTVHETWFPHSEKGSRSLHRPPRQRAAAHRIDMIPVWVLVARDRGGRVASEVIGRARPGAADLDRALGARLPAAAELVSRFGPYGAAGTFALRSRRRYRCVDFASHELQAVLRYILALHRWIRRFQGVATRYLGNYLAWHRLLEAADRSPYVGAGRRWLLAARCP